MAKTVLLLVLISSTACAQAFNPVRAVRACRLPWLRTPRAALAGEPGGAPRSTARPGHAIEPLAPVRQSMHVRSSPVALGDEGLIRVMTKSTTAIVGIAATSAIGLGVKHLYDWYISDEKRFVRFVCKAKISPQILKKSALPYVARAQIDAELGAFVEHAGERIVIVIGPRGAGKTTAVAHALEQTDGVIMLSVTGEHKRDTGIYASLLDNTLGRTPYSTSALSQNQMVGYLKAAASRYGKLHPHAADWKPTLVFELETKAEPATVSLAVQTMKNLVCDRAVCHGFVVLSDAHSIYAVTTDTGRHAYTWTGDFSSAEADAYLDVLGVLSAADERALRAEVYAKASTRAIDLSNLAAELNSSTGVPAHDVVRAFVGKQQADGMARVENLIGVSEKAAKAEYGMRGLHFIRLMKAMLKNGGSLRMTDAKYMCSEIGIADVLKLSQHHAISINTQTRTFVFNTPADRVAAEQVLGQYDKHDDGFGPMVPQVGG
jgi:hypothetical protein